MRTPQNTHPRQFFALMHEGDHAGLLLPSHLHDLTITPAMTADIAEAFLLVNMDQILTFVETSVN